MTCRANWNLDARVERIEFGKSQQGDPFFKITKLLRGTLREYWFPPRDYELERAQIMAALKTKGRAVARKRVGPFQTCGQNSRARALGPNTAGMA